MRLPLILALIAATAPAHAQDTLVIDLSGKTAIKEMDVDPGTYSLTLEYLAPDSTYWIEAGRIRSEIKPDDPIAYAPDFSKIHERLSAMAGTPPALNKIKGASCLERLAQLRPLLGGDISESTIRSSFEKFETDADGLVHAGTCSRLEADAAVATLRKMITLVSAQKISIAANEEVTIKVMKAKGGEEPTLVQSARYRGTGEPKGTWLTFYGFNFIKDRDQEYYSREVRNDAGTISGYEVAKVRSNGGSVLAPSVYFMYLPPDERRNGLLSPVAWRKGPAFGGLTAGLGFDQSEPNVFFGYGAGWGSNVMLTFGISYRKIKTLSGRYSEGDFLQQSLTSELEDTTYERATYLGVAFRFGANPFKGKEGSSGGSATP